VSEQVNERITYRPFTSDDITAAHALTVELKWPHRADDWRFVVQAGAGFVAQTPEGVIGTALYWTYGTERASLGMVIVSPAWQGRGIGKKLMELVLEQLDGRVTFLHATTALREAGFSGGWHARSASRGCVPAAAGVVAAG
jgi:GNAT superfamily N-acetyltransferase